MRKSESEIEKIEKSNRWEHKKNVITGGLTALATNQAFAGDVFGAIESFNRLNKINEQIKSQNPSSVAIANEQSDHIKSTINFQKEISDASYVDAIQAIVNEASKRQVVILNEAHHVPMHRAFAMILARELRKIGYEYLACEAFSNTNQQPLAKKYVRYSDGFYINEPMYANFLRDAIESKWKFVSYEPTASPREYLMAKNIVNKILRSKPTAKILIYVGYEHVNKLPEARYEQDNSWFAAQFKRLTGIDPLTIDQTAAYQQYESRPQVDLYKSLLSRNVDDRPFVLTSSNGTYLKIPHAIIPASAVDMQIIFPDYEIEKTTGRASWLTKIADFMPTDIPSHLIPKAGRHMVYAYRLNDPTDAVPVDVVKIENGKPIPKLMLPPGEYRFAIEN